MTLSIPSSSSLVYFEIAQSNRLQEQNPDLGHSNNLIDLVNKDEAKLNDMLPFNQDSVDPAKILAAVASHQSQIVLAMVSQYPEMAISMALASSLESYAKQLEYIEGWTNGGVDMFESCLLLMLQDLLDGGIQPEQLEDVFQIVLLDVMINHEKYGLTDWYEANSEDISHILESIGSGSHGLHEKDYDTPAKLAAITQDLYNGILDNGTYPDDSILGVAMAGLEAAGGANALSDQIEHHYYDDYGWWDSGSDNISPMLRLFVLSESLAQHPVMTQEEVELILTGSVDELNKYINDTFGTDPAVPLTALDFLVDSTSWQVQTGYSYDGGHTTQLDWKGDGINPDDLDDLHSNFPPRELTEDELAEVNRIGDQVKVIQQTLKYWLQICRDEQMAFARNT